MINFDILDLQDMQEIRMDIKRSVERIPVVYEGIGQRTVATNKTMLITTDTYTRRDKAGRLRYYVVQQCNLCKHVHTRARDYARINPRCSVCCRKKCDPARRTKNTAPISQSHMYQTWKNMKRRAKRDGIEVGETIVNFKDFQQIMTSGYVFAHSKNKSKTRLCRIDKTKPFTQNNLTWS